MSWYNKMSVTQRRNIVFRPFIFLTLALIFLTCCNFMSSTPTPKPNTENIKLIGHIAESNQTVSKSGKQSSPQGLEVANNFAYIAIPICIDDTDDALRYSCNENWLRVIDMSDLAKPTEFGIYNSPVNAISDIAVSGNYAYITSDVHGLTIWDISNRLAPAKVSFYERLLRKGYISSNYRVIVKKDNAYVTVQQCKVEGGGCVYEEWILDISKPQAPTEVQTREITEYEAFRPHDFQDVAMTDDYIYIARGNKGLSIIDSSNPAKELEIGYYNTPAGIWSVAIDDKTDGLFYIADYNGGVYVLQLVTNPK
jgi:hypothetical protein